MHQNPTPQPRRFPLSSGTTASVRPGPVEGGRLPIRADTTFSLLGSLVIASVLALSLQGCLPGSRKEGPPRDVPVMEIDEGHIVSSAPSQHEKKGTLAHGGRPERRGASSSQEQDHDGHDHAGHDHSAPNEHQDGDGHNNDDDAPAAGSSPARVPAGSSGSRGGEEGSSRGESAGSSSSEGSSSRGDESSAGFSSARPSPSRGPALTPEQLREAGSGTANCQCDQQKPGCRCGHCSGAIGRCHCRHEK